MLRKIMTILPLHTATITGSKEAFSVNLPPPLHVEFIVVHENIVINGVEVTNPSAHLSDCPGR